MERFTEFWKIYPRKAGKVDALKSWKRIKPNIELTAKMLAKITEQRHSEDWARENGKYIPHPATWLNKGCWDDEAVEIVDPPKQKRIWKTSDYL